MKKIYRIQRDNYGWATPCSQIDVCYQTKEAARAALMEIAKAGGGEVSFFGGVYLVDRGMVVAVTKTKYKQIDGEDWYQAVRVEEKKYEKWRIREVTLK